MQLFFLFLRPFSPLALVLRVLFAIKNIVNSGKTLRRDLTA